MQVSSSWWDYPRVMTETVYTKTQQTWDTVWEWWSPPKPQQEEEDKEKKVKEGWNIEEGLLTAHQVIGAVRKVSRVSKRILGRVTEEEKCGPVMGILGGVSAVSSIGNLRRGVERLHALRERREVTDSSLTLCLDTGRVLGGIASVANMADELAMPLPLISELSQPFFFISGFISFLTPVRLALRWQDCQKWGGILDNHLRELEKLEDASEEELRSRLLLLFGELLQYDDFYLKRQFHWKNGDSDRLALVVRNVLQEQEGSLDAGTELVQDLKGRVDKRIRGHQIEAVATTASLAGFTLLLFSPATLAAHGLMGAGAVVGLSKVAYDYLAYRQAVGESPLPEGHYRKPTESADLDLTEDQCIVDLLVS